MGIEGEVDCLDNLQTAVRKHSSGLSEDTDLTLEDLLLFLTLVLQVNKRFSPEQIKIPEQQETERRIKEVFSGTTSGGSKLKKSKTNKKNFKKSSKKLRTRIKKGYLKTLKNRHNFKKGQKKTLKNKKGGSPIGTLGKIGLGLLATSGEFPTNATSLEKARPALPSHVLSSKDFNTGFGHHQIKLGKQSANPDYLSENHRMKQAQTRRTGNDFKDELVSRIEAAIEYNPELSTSEAANLLLKKPGDPGFIPTKTWIDEQNMRGKELSTSQSANLVKKKPGDPGFIPTKTWIDEQNMRGEEEKLRHVVDEYRTWYGKYASIPSPVDKLNMRGVEGERLQSRDVPIYMLPTEDRLKIYTKKPQIIDDVVYYIKDIQKTSDKIFQFKFHTEAKEGSDVDFVGFGLNLELIGEGVDKITFSLIEDSPKNHISEKLKGKVIKFHTEASDSYFGENVLSDNLKTDLVSSGLLIPDEKLSENLSIADKVTPLKESQKKTIYEALTKRSNQYGSIIKNKNLPGLAIFTLKNVFSEYMNYIPYLARLRSIIDETDESSKDLKIQFYNNVNRIGVMGGIPTDIHGGNWGITDDGRLVIIDEEAFQDRPYLGFDKKYSNLLISIRNINLAFLFERNIYSLIYSLFDVKQLNTNQLVIIFFSLYKIWTIKKSIQTKSRLLAFLDVILPVSINLILHMLRLFGTLIKGLVRMTVRRLRVIVMLLVNKGNRVLTGKKEDDIITGKKEDDIITGKKEDDIMSKFLEIEEQVDLTLIDKVINDEKSLLTRVDQCLPGANMYLIKGIKYNSTDGKFSESGAHEVTSGQRIIIEDFDDIDNTVKISIPTSPPTRITGVPSNLYKKLKIGDQVVNDGITLTVIREEEIPELEEMRYTITIGPKTGEYGTSKEVSPNDIKLVTSDS